VLTPDGAGSLARDRRGALRRSAKSSETGIADALQNASIFSLCSKRELKLVAKVANTRTVPADVTLLVEGDTGDSFIVLLSGRAEVRKSNRKIAELGSGDVVGELALLAKAPRNATVVTRSESEIAIIGRRDLFRLIDDAPGFSRKLLEALANRVRELDRHAAS
jgi:CRP-like cAMP-binding protein